MNSRRKLLTINNIACCIADINAGSGLKSRSQKCVGGGFSLKLGQLDPGQEISTRCLSVNLAIILLWSNQSWPPSTIMKKSDFLFLSLISCVILLIQGSRIHS